MIIVRKAHFDSPLEAQMAAYVSPDPRNITEVDSIDEGIEAATSFIQSNNYTGNIEIIDYTPHTFCSPAKRKLLKTINQNGAVAVI